MSVENPGSLNRYSYFLNDPINNIDPSGNEPINPRASIKGYLEGSENWNNKYTFDEINEEDVKWAFSVAIGLSPADTIKDVIDFFCW